MHMMTTILPHHHGHLGFVLPLQLHVTQRLALLIHVLLLLQHPFTSQAFHAVIFFGSTGFGRNPKLQSYPRTRTSSSVDDTRHDNTAPHPQDQSAQEVVSSFVASFYNTSRSDHRSMSDDDDDGDDPSRYNHPISNYFDCAVEFIDTSFYKPIIGKNALIQQFNESPTSLLHINGTLPDLRNVSYVVDGGGDVEVTRDIKIAMLYEYEYSPPPAAATTSFTSISSSSSTTSNKSKVDTALPQQDGTAMIRSWRYGITLFTVSDGFLSQVFDVKGSANELDVSFLRAENVPDMTQSNGGGTSGRAGIANAADSKVCDDNLISIFLEARNKRDVAVLNNLMEEDCATNGFIVRSIMGRRSAYIEHLTGLPYGVTLETIDVVSTLSRNGTSKAAVRWIIAVNGQPQRYSRGCTYVALKNGHITFLVDILESVKQEGDIFGDGKLGPFGKNWLRDSGISGAVFDALMVSSFPGILQDNDPKAIFQFARLSARKNTVKYGEHPSQIMDLFLPDNFSERRGLLFFVHGGAWGSGKPWMYRLIATPFLDANMAVAILGYRTYPDGNMQDQIDDIELASKKIAIDFPDLILKPEIVDAEDWLGSSLIGHSSGVHIGLLAVAQRAERWALNDIDDKHLKFDYVIGLSGVYTISEHFDFEVSRGVEEISSMKAAAGFTVESFDYFSPAARLAKISSFEEQPFEKLPQILLLHGDEDVVVPFTSARRTVRLLQSIGCKDVDTKILKLGHADTLFHVMFGGETREILMNWLQNR